MPTNDSTRARKRREREFERQMLRAAFQSLFLSIIQRKKKNGYMLQDLAAATQNLKSTVSRWFSPNPTNWQIDTLADIAEALDVDIILQARDRKTGEIHTPQGVQETSRSSSDAKQPGALIVVKFPVVLREEDSKSEGAYSDAATGSALVAMA